MGKETTSFPVCALAGAIVVDERRKMAGGRSDEIS